VAAGHNLAAFAVVGGNPWAGPFAAVEDSLAAFAAEDNQAAFTAGDNLAVPFVATRGNPFTAGDSLAVPSVVTRDSPFTAGVAFAVEDSHPSVVAAFAAEGSHPSVAEGNLGVMPLALADPWRRHREASTNFSSGPVLKTYLCR